ncbi:MAG: hypothetical protein HY318_07700 [Armatimonadetes bacterium]|nr:hypothetical protein [Armatimonadota bacterium]
MFLDSAFLNESPTQQLNWRISDCEDITLFQAIAGNRLESVPSLVHVIGGRHIALFNSAVTNTATVITEEPHGWSAGAASTDRGFTRQTAWILGKSGRGRHDTSSSVDE